MPGAAAVFASAAGRVFRRPSQEKIAAIMRAERMGKRFDKHHPRTMAELAKMVAKRAKKEGKGKPPKLESCSVEELLGHFEREQVEPYWRAHLSRVLDAPFWTTLSTHKNDETLAADPYSVAAWPVDPGEFSAQHPGSRAEGPTGKGYRYFRIRCTGVNHTGNNFRLCLGGIELYGELIETR